MTKQDIVVDLLKKYVGLPYKWGGDDTIKGFDCSGLVVEVLQSVGILRSDEDYTAHQLAENFEETDILEPGTLIFYDWNKDGHIDHVEMIAFIDDDGQVFTIAATGGNSATTTESVASAQNAFIKIRPLRSGFVKANNPF